MFCLTDFIGQLQDLLKIDYEYRKKLKTEDNPNALLDTNTFWRK